MTQPPPPHIFPNHHMNPTTATAQVANPAANPHQNIIDYGRAFEFYNPPARRHDLGMNRNDNDPHNVAAPAPGGPPAEPGDKVNLYRCSAGHATVTIDVDEGVTPFMMGCAHKGCDLDSQSAFYPQGVRTLMVLEKFGQPTHEWYKPTPEQLYMQYSHDVHILANMIDHVKRGGLDLRTRTDKPGVKHK